MVVFSMRFGDKVYELNLLSLDPLQTNSNVTFHCVPSNARGETDTMIELKNFSGSIRISAVNYNESDEMLMNAKSTASIERGKKRRVTPELDDADEKMLSIEDEVDSLKSEEFMEGLDEVEFEVDEVIAPNGFQSCSEESSSSSSNESNIGQIQPRVGMRVDVRDKDFIWCPATIKSVSKTKNAHKVTINYDGWDTNWDEVLGFPNPRLAQRFSYTKEVKCFVTLIPTQKETKEWNKCIWPCKVQFQMPDRGVSFHNACECLRKQTNLFIIPYKQRKLPKKVKDRIKNGGIWVHISNVCAWKTYFDGGTLNHNQHATGFCQALNEALRDNSTEGVLPPQSFDSGVLLKRRYLAKRTNSIPSNSLN